VGDTFKKVQSGDPLRIPAETFNTFIDAARDFKSRRQSRTRESQVEFRQTGIIPVKNNSGADRNRFDVLGIDRPIFTPADNLLSFQNQVSLVGVTPTEVDHLGRFVVLLEPVRTGAIGQACISGVCPIRLNVLDEEHEFAEIEEGCSENLQSATAGSGFILWKEPVDYAEYGGCYSYGYDLLRWALVRIGNLSDGDQWGVV